MSLRLMGPTRHSAIASLMLALGSACATSEEPSPEPGSGGSTGFAGQGPLGGASFGGNPEPSGGRGGGASGMTGQGGARGGSTQKGDGGASSGRTGGGTAGGGRGGAPGIAGSNAGGEGGEEEGGSSSGGRASAGSSSGGRASGGRASGGSASGGRANGGSGGASAGAGGEGARASCDWTGECAAKSCSKACPTSDGGDCAARCGALITCVQKTTTCPTKTDPMCVQRIGSTSMSNECTSEWETAGGSTITGPSKVATLYFECACGENVP